MIRKFINKLWRLAILIGVASVSLCNFICNAALEDAIKFPEGTVEGTLPNGLRYLILRNDFPASRVEYRLVWRVGALQQDDSQGGCAHFLEHMAFGGSEHFPERGAVAYLESLGMKYGIDINAFTGQDRTIYMFATPSDIPSEGGVANAFSIISDWMDKLIINPDRVKTEKGIIQEELRGYVVDDPFYDLKIGQNRFGKRMPLGTPEEVDAVTSKSLKDFYRKWYLPRFAGIVVVGDVDPVEVEKEIKRQFTRLKAGKDPGFKQYTLDYSPANQIMVYTDSLINQKQLEIIIPHPSYIERSIADLRRSAIGRIIVGALNRRMSQREIPAEVSDAWYLGSTNHFVFSMRESQSSKLEDIIRQTASVVNEAAANGFYPDEIAYFAERSAKAIGQNSYDGSSSAMICDDFSDYFISGDRHISDRDQIEELQEVVATITADEATQMLKEWLSSSGVMLMALRTGDDIDDAQALAEFSREWQSGIVEHVNAYVFSRPEDRVDEVVETPEVLKAHYEFNPSMIVDKRDYPSLGITEILLGNGLTLLLKKTVDDGSVLFSMVAPGGLGTIPESELPLFDTTASFIDMGGIAKAPGGIGDYMYANDIALGMTLENDWHGFLGSFAPDKDNEFFNLVYEKITDPELNYEDFEEIRASMYEEPQETILAKMLKRAPDRQLIARIGQLIGSVIDVDAPFHNVQNTDSLRRSYADRLNLDSISAFYHDLYAQPRGAVFILSGNFDADTIAHDFVSVFGRLIPSENSPLGFSQLKMPSETQTERFDSEDIGKTEFDYLYFGKYEPGLRESLVLKLMSFILRNRVIADLREKRALVYSPYVILNYEGLPHGYYYFDISSSSDNRNMHAVKQALAGVIEELRTNPVGESELEAIKRSCIINRRETLNPQSPSAWRNLLMNLVKNGEDLADFEKYESIINSITSDEILQGFNKYINPNLYVLLYISDEEIK